jgi:hypothetical protein
LSSTDSLLAAPPATRTETDSLVAVVCFGIAIVVGLADAFVGLDTHGFWFDELFTARLIEPDGTSLTARIATDVHPPVYLVLLSLYSKIAGGGDAALRSLSALAATASILVFVAATRRTFTLPGRLFGATLATGSLFWFFQAQNARSYALCLLIGAGILACSLALLDKEQKPVRARLRLGGMVSLMFVGTFTHFYMLYESLAVLFMLFVLSRKHRYATAAAAVALVVASALYMKLVVEPHTLVSLSHNWYQNNPTWYFLVLKSCLHYTFGDAGLLAIALCAGAVVAGRLANRNGTPFVLDRVAALLVGVPVLVLLAVVASSTLLAPNFFDRNYLVLSPFLWALAASLYDAARRALRPPLQLALNVVLSFLALSMACIVTFRLPSAQALPLYEPFRESAAWIATLPSCRDQVVPVISTDRRNWYKPGYAETIYTSGYGRYLHGFARPELLFFHDVRARNLPDDLTAELRRRIDGEGCPVLAWSAHNITAEVMAAATSALLAWTDRPASAAVKVKAFEDGGMGFVLYVERPAGAAVSR